MLSDSAKKQQQFIQTMRKLRGPIEVNQGHTPNWFRKAMLRAFGSYDRCCSGADMIRHLDDMEARFSWLDHEGSSRLLSGEVVFVAEPYGLNQAGIKEAFELAVRLGCHCHVSDNSWWYPGYTSRIEFSEQPPAAATLLTRIAA